MTSDLTLRIEHSNGNQSKLRIPTPTAIDSNAVTLAAISIDRDLDRIARAEARVFRSEWRDVLSDLDRRDDELFIDDDAGNTLFGGRIDDWEFGGPTVSVFVNSFEVDATDDDPPSSFSRSGVSDKSIASDLIGLMGAKLSAGTIDQTTSSLDYSATHTAPGAMLRDLAATTGADVRYRPDGTVDYLADRGTTLSETLSPASGAAREPDGAASAAASSNTPMRPRSAATGKKDGGALQQRHPPDEENRHGDRQRGVEGMP